MSICIYILPMNTTPLIICNTAPIIAGPLACSCTSFKGENTLNNGKLDNCISPKKQPNTTPHHISRSAVNLAICRLCDRGTEGVRIEACLALARSFGTSTEATLDIARRMVPVHVYTYGSIMSMRK